MLISGSCHCRNLSFVLEWRPEPETIPARACTCTFCTKHGGVWTSCPGGTLTLGVRDAAHASTYAFGTSTAEFHVCTRCGGVPFVTSRIDDRLFAVVNVNAFDDVDPALLDRSPSTLDDETEPTRLARRARSWIGDVGWVGDRR